MKPKINPDIEAMLLPICYLEHLGNSGPEFRRAIELLPMFNKYNNLWEQLTELKQTLGFAIIFPEFNFSKLLSKHEYHELSQRGIDDINNRYLLIPNNRLSEQEREDILNRLSNFYSATEYSLIPFYNQYRATKHDRMAYAGLSFLYFITLLANLIDNLKREQKNTEVKIEEITQQLKKLGVDTEYDDKQHKENALTKFDETFTDKHLDLMMHHFRLDPESKQDLNNNQMFSGFSIQTIFEDNLDLDNKSLESNYIRLIYEQVEKVFPELTYHRQATLTGFIALHFDILKESDYLSKTNDYLSLPTYLRDRVQGVLKTYRGKLKKKK